MVRMLGPSVGAGLATPTATSEACGTRVEPCTPLRHIMIICVESNKNVYMRKRMGNPVVSTGACLPCYAGSQRDANLRGRQGQLGGGAPAGSGLHV